MKISSLLIALCVVLLSAHAEAGPVFLYTDAEVVGRAELIVLAHVKEGSIKKLRGDGDYRHTAVLVVSRVIKGKYQEKELPITIAYGLLPVSAPYEKNLFGDADATVRPPEIPGETTKIYEDNSSTGFIRPSGDVNHEQIWLLHRLDPWHEKNSPDAAPEKALGISDPEDLQPATRERQITELVHAP